MVTKLAETVSGKITGTGSHSRPGSRQNSRTRRKPSTELEAFEDARTYLSRPSDSSDASYQGNDRMAEPMATHQ